MRRALPRHRPGLHPGPRGRGRPGRGGCRSRWLRPTGPTLIANAVDAIARVARGDHGLVPCFHPHAGTHVEFETEIERLIAGRIPSSSRSASTPGTARTRASIPRLLYRRHARPGRVPPPQGRPTRTACRAVPTVLRAGGRRRRVLPARRGARGLRRAARRRSTSTASRAGPRSSRTACRATTAPRRAGRRQPSPPARGGSRGVTAVRLTAAQALVRFLAPSGASATASGAASCPASSGSSATATSAASARRSRRTRAQLRVPPAQERAGDGARRDRLRARAAPAARRSPARPRSAPGSTNLLTGAATATVNRVPVLLLPVRHVREPRARGRCMQALEHRARGRPHGQRRVPPAQRASSTASRARSSCSPRCPRRCGCCSIPPRRRGDAVAPPGRAGRGLRLPARCSSRAPGTSPAGRRRPPS